MNSIIIYNIDNVFTYLFEYAQFLHKIKVNSKQVFIVMLRRKTTVKMYPMQPMNNNKKSCQNFSFINFFQIIRGKVVNDYY